MVIRAIVGAIGNSYVATLSDGRIVEESDLRMLAVALSKAGVLSREVNFDWQAGQRMMTAGQRVALCASIRTLEREPADAHCQMLAFDATAR